MTGVMEGPELAAAVASMLQGVLAMSAVRQDVIKVATVEQGRDEAGTYENHFTVVTAAGHRIRVTVEVEAS